MNKRSLFLFAATLSTVFFLIWLSQLSDRVAPGRLPSVLRPNQSGRAVANVAASPTAGRLQNISRIVHQSWKTRQLPARAKRWSASWPSCFPNWEWRLWTDEDNLALVRDHYAWFLPVYNGYRYNIERADLARYFYMYHFGGIYTDLDTVCMKNFEHLLKSETLLFGGMDTRPGEALQGQIVQNSFMASLRPGHPFWMRLLKRIEQNFKAGKRGRPEDNTGPGVLMQELRVYMLSNATDFKIYPGKFFNPFSWTLGNSPACKDFGQMSDSQEKICLASFPDALVVQLHTQSWGRGRMR